MTKLILTIELDYDAELLHGDDSDAIEWFNESVLGGELILHSNEIGDEIGPVKILKLPSHKHPSIQATNLTQEEIDYLNLLMSIDALRIHQLAPGDKTKQFEIRHGLRTKFLKLTMSLDRNIDA